MPGPTEPASSEAVVQERDREHDETSVKEKSGTHVETSPLSATTSSPPIHPPGPPQRRRHPILQVPWSWLAALCATALFILTVIYAASTTALLRSAFAVRSPFNTILVLTVLSELTKLGLGGALDGAVERAQWMLLARPRRGLAVADYLALDRGTSQLGLLSLIFSRRAAGHLFSAVRLTSTLAIAALSVILLSNVSGTQEFVSGPSFPVAAGVGDFNASWVDDYQDIAALLFQTDLDRFLADSLKVVAVDPVVSGTSICRDGSELVGAAACKAAYFVPGGLELVSPWPTRNQDELEKPVYTIFNMQGI